LQKLVANIKSFAIPLHNDADRRRTRFDPDGDCFGEIALVTDRPRNATLRALTAATCLTPDRAHFQQLLPNSPDTQERISQMVQSRLEADDL
jgi:hypothetical protein